MSNVEHYFENLLYHDCDVKDDINKNGLSKDVQEAVYQCYQYVLYNIFSGRDDFEDFLHERSFLNYEI